MSKHVMYEKVIEEFEIRIQNQNVANQNQNDATQNQNDATQNQNDATQNQNEDSQVKKDSNQPSLSNRFRQFFRSLGNMIFCCKNPTDEKSSYETISL